MNATKTLSLVVLLTVAAACTPGAPTSTASPRPPAPATPSPATPAPGTPGPASPAPATPAPASPTPGAPSPNPSTAPPATGAAGVDGRDFIATRVTDGGEPVTLVPDTQIRLGFRDGQISASAGCNQFGGQYQIDGNRIVIDGGSMTEMGCDPARSAQDDWLVRFLNNDPTFVVDGDRLTLTYENAEIELLDAEVAEPDQPLTGTTWTLTSLIAGDGVSSVPAGAIATIVFNADRSIDVRPGCNTGGGDYTVDGDTITFGDIFLTRMACMEPFMQVEQAVLDVLSVETGVTYTIDAGTLTLTAGEIGLQFSSGAAQ